MLDAHQLTQDIKNWARQAGFDLVGIALPEKSRFSHEYNQWLREGKHGDMAYLARTADRRNDLSAAFPWVKSVVCVAMAYYQQMPEAPADAPTDLAPAESAAADDGMGKVARYAWGRDYHKVLLKALKTLEVRLRSALPATSADEFVSRAYVDTGPIDERDLAARAGLGWVGKNTLLIHPVHGSWFVLGELLTSLPLPADHPLPDRCGTCTRCIDVCPTGAIAPYKVDATRCISYQTLENRGDIPPELHGPMAQAGFLAGCDICQDVCPWNRRPLVTSQPEFAPAAPAPAIGLKHILNFSETQWDQLTRGKAHRRAKWAMWRRTAAILADARTGS